MKKIYIKNRGLWVGIGLSVATLAMVPLITGAAPSSSPPTGNISPTFSGLNINNGSGNTLSVNSGGDISNPSANPVEVRDPSGLQIDSTDPAKGLIVNSTNGGIGVNDSAAGGLTISAGTVAGLALNAPVSGILVNSSSGNGGMTINAANGGETINTNGGGLTINATGTGGFNLATVNGGIENNGAKVGRPAETKPVTITDAEGLAVSNYLWAGKGVWLPAADEPFITRGWDIFTSGSKALWGRWGIFMEPSALTMGIPNIGGKSFKVSAYNADSTIAKDLMVMDTAGNTVIAGHLKAASIGGYGYSWTGSYPILPYNAVTNPNPWYSAIKYCPQNTDVATACSYRTTTLIGGNCTNTTETSNILDIYRFIHFPQFDLSSPGYCYVGARNNGATGVCLEVTLNCGNANA